MYTNNNKKKKKKKKNDKKRKNIQKDWKVRAGGEREREIFIFFLSFTSL